MPLPPWRPWTCRRRRRARPSPGPGRSSAPTPPLRRSSRKACATVAPSRALDAGGHRRRDIRESEPFRSSRGRRAWPGPPRIRARSPSARGLATGRARRATPLAMKGLLRRVRVDGDDPNGARGGVGLQASDGLRPAGMSHVEIDQQQLGGRAPMASSPSTRLSNARKRVLGANFNKACSTAAARPRSSSTIATSAIAAKDDGATA